MARITLRQLQYFDTLARLKHFGRAAEACHVSQPALTQQIQELETQLGAQLVERRRHGAMLTGEGALVAAKAAEVLRAAHDLIESVAHRRAPLSGGLRLGIIPTLAPYLLPALLPELVGRYPDLELHIRETQTDLLLEELAEARLDVVLAALPIEHAELTEMPLFEDRFVLALPMRCASREPVSLADPELRREPLLLLEEGHCFRDQAIQVCRLHQAGALNTLGASSFATIVQMVANGLGITLLPEIALPTELSGNRVRILRLAGAQPARSIGLLWRKSSPRKADFDVLAEIILRVHNQRRAGQGMEHPPEPPPGA